MRRIAISIFATLLLASPAFAVKVADITRLGGQRENSLTGLGLVYGLNGTGDGGDFLPAIKPLAALLGKYANPTTVKELGNASNVAVVYITARIPSTGVRTGDEIDIYVTSYGAASSLKGGRLAVSPLVGPLGQGDIMALATGPIVIEDPTNLRTARIQGGATMEVSMPARVVNDKGTFLLILDEPAANYTTASTIAKVINDAEGDSQTIAVVRDAKTIEVLIPTAERSLPDSFISRVQRLPVPQLPAEARVTVNARTGTMIITGDVEISAVVISHKGLTVTVPSNPTAQQPPAAPQNPRGQPPVVETRNFIPLEVGEKPSPSAAARLQDLVTALDQLKVPAEDRIAIVRELHRSGKLHAKLIEE